MYFVDVILPIPVDNAFTYRISEAEYSFIKPGMRLAVPFGKSKIYTSMALSVHQNEPRIYEAKEIEQILDETPIVHPEQLTFWKWMAEYYMCTLGEVMRAALPGAFLLESETIIKRIVKNSSQPHLDVLDEEAEMILQAFENKPILRVSEVMQLLGKKRVLPSIKTLIDLDLVMLDQEIYESYKPKLISYVRLTPDYEVENMMHQALDELDKAPKQREILLTYFSLQARSKKAIKSKDLQDASSATAAQIKALVSKGIFETYKIQKDRIIYSGNEDSKIKDLNKQQERALKEIKESYSNHEVCLLHGVTASGKTEVYVNLIKSYLDAGKQVLYLLPEIALTTQLVSRLQEYFGNQLSVFHSKYSVHERVEVWNNVLNIESKAQLILGARSALFLPFSNLGLVVVDEEHESSYKQYDPAPRYQARDAGIVLASLQNAKVLLGSATPSLETYYNASSGKYGLVTMRERYGNILMPENSIIDIQDRQRKKRMTGHFSDDLQRAITDALALGEQVILFQNRRGYSPILECNTCGHAPQCPNCDVSLTYHKHKEQLRCHYCGYHIAMLQKCMACGSAELDTKGFGTEQIETELKALYPDYAIGRMDSDTTRGKFGFEKIITAFEQGEIDILVGTQMLTKGLDFRNVTLVGILNADNMLNIPDFRAHERSFQLIQQVSGRAGRTEKRGTVLIQSYNPHHQILQQVSMNDYEAMYHEQLEERHIYKYPPFCRLIKITLKHKDFQKIEEASQWLGQALKNIFRDEILGPEPPPVSRIRNEYHRNILIKIPRKQSLTKTKQAILKVRTSFLSISQFRSVKIVINVDNY
ncbi:replication restart helicase PriA [Leeuwenhoekiella aequorea]|uniref:Replication restart protein PriA n=1 Tax=Leeuwenhoekiella aequorea TaxID=283736 RepID=A0A4Q0P2R9_9FLAO|nr:primosomal protein N' [Leeuwenhoekiella aequorea]RXG20777.1 replication restart DNA helicase PriA [Leeuwenhoekiella aequorea]